MEKNSKKLSQLEQCNIMNNHYKRSSKNNYDKRVLKQSYYYPVEQQFPPIDNNKRIGNIQNNPNANDIFFLSYTFN